MRPEEERRFKFGTLSFLTVAAGLAGTLLVVAQSVTLRPSFTATQATQGAALFAEKCAVCHGAKLEGGAGPALSGASFSQTAATQGLTVRSLLNVVSTTMPTTAPASLPQDQYEALVAFLLAANGYQSGDTPLRKDSPGLDRAKLDQVASGGGSVATRPASSGVYNAAQAAHGKALYLDNCLVCHGGDLDGVEDAPPLAGRAFLSKWVGQPVGAVYALIDNSMPPGNGGAVGPVAEADIVAYILSRNNYPSGSNPLPSDPRGLAAIMVDKPPAIGN